MAIETGERELYRCCYLLGNITHEIIKIYKGEELIWEKTDASSKE